MKYRYLLLIFNIILLNGCIPKVEKNSFDEYRLWLAKHQGGFSHSKLDRPQFFLPTESFIDDYKYIAGLYYLYEEDQIISKKIYPSKVVLIIKYDFEIYFEAKQNVIVEIKPFINSSYFYNDYIFFFNEIFSYADGMLEKFTMFGYNDLEYSLAFIGFDNPIGNNDKYFKDFENNFDEFMDDFFGSYFTVMEDYYKGESNDE